MNASLQQLQLLLRRSPVVTVGLTALVLLGIANYFLWTQQQSLAQQHGEVRRNGEAMQLSLTGQARVSNELARVGETLKIIDQNLVVEGDLAENLGYFYQMETLSRVRLSQLNQLNSPPRSDDNPYKAIPFSFRVTGSYAQILNFVRALESGPRLLKIRTYSFSRGDPKLSTLTLDLNVDLLGSP